MSTAPTYRDLGQAFLVGQARQIGVPYAQLRRDDLKKPFYGVRVQGSDASVAASDPFAQQRAEHRQRIAEYAPRLLTHTFISHESAAAWYEAPLPLRVNGVEAIDGRQLPVHVSVMGDQRMPHSRGVRGHRANPATASVIERDGIRISSPATTWASLGQYPVRELVMLGDYFCRVFRPGVGRPTGRAPLATLEQLAAAIAAGRRVGINNLRAALPLIREDSWSPKETEVRLILVDAGLPEPVLNRDIFERGEFLGALDMAYLHEKVGVEYNGTVHAAQYAKDVERTARFRAAGWIIIEVTHELLQNPTELVRRVREALRSRRF